MVFSLTTPLWVSLVAQLVKNQPAMQETWVQSLGWEDSWRRKQLPTPVFWPREYHELYSRWGCKELNMTIPLGEKAMASHSSTLAWKIPWMEEPGSLQSMGSLRVGHYWATSLSLFTFMHWRRKWQPTPVFLPGGSQGWQSMVGCCLWGRTESDTIEET